MLPADLSNSLRPPKRPRQDDAKNTTISDSKRGRFDLGQSVTVSPQVDEGPDSQTPSFVHQPLQLVIASLRLVDVLPLGDDGTVRCKIRHTTLDKLLQDEIGYTCLSYVWGPPAPTHRISMNGIPIRVRKNLFDFLHVMSTLVSKNEDLNGPTMKEPSTKFFRTNHRPLWIDALCIDQENNVERNHQVKNMGKIYSNAKTTIAWMGHDSDLAALFSSMLPESDDSKRLSPDSKRHLSEVFCSHEYWNRAWITQEVLLGHKRYLLAKDMFLPLEELWGKRNKSGKVNYQKGILALNPALEHSNAKLNETYVRANKHVPFQRELSGDFRSFTLLENFERFQYKQCTDVRDRAYSLIHVSKEGLKLHIDYESSLSNVAKDVLRLQDGGVCFYRANVVLQGLRIPQGDATPDADVPFVSIGKSSLMRHLSPCSQCGEQANMDKFSMTSRMRCICLHCNHHKIPQDSGLHMNAHLGHLILVQSEKERFKIRLMWCPLGGGTWHEVGDHEQATVTRGESGCLVLSLGAVCELIDLFTAEEARFQPSLNRLLQQTYGSHLTSTWKVVS